MQYRIILMSYYCSIVFYLWHYVYALCSHLYDSLVLRYVYKLDWKYSLLLLAFKSSCLTESLLISLPVESPTTDLAATLKLIPTECQVTLTADIRDMTVSSSSRSSCKSYIRKNTLSLERPRKYPKGCPNTT